LRVGGSTQPPQNGGHPEAHPGDHQGGLANARMTLSIPTEPQARPSSPSEKLQPKRPPRPPRGRRPKGKRRRLPPVLRALSGLLTLLLLIMAGTGVLALIVKVNFNKAGPLRQASLITVPHGRGLNAIAAYLQREGIISDSRLFVANVYYKGAQSRLRAGKYEIPRGASINEVVDRLVKGKTIGYKLTFIEGQTSQQIVGRLNAAAHLVGKITLVPPEGTLLPDTYVYEGETKRSEILDRMRMAQQKLLDRLWPNRQQGLPLQSKQEALILASIVEKETGKAEERAKVAAVYVNRLKKGIRLQSDPTIIYGLVGGRGRLGHPIRVSELKRKTAYNTYQIDRLPPTPICNPGQASIEAVLNPAISNDLFFVADGSGGHVFAKTLKEHKANVRNWRKIEKSLRARRRRQAAAAVAKKAAAAKKGAAVASSSPLSVPLPGLAAPGAAFAAVAPAAAANGSANAGAARSGRRMFHNSKAGGTAAIPLPVRKPKRRRR